VARDRRDGLAVAGTATVDVAMDFLEVFLLNLVESVLAEVLGECVETDVDNTNSAISSIVSDVSITSSGFSVNNTNSAISSIVSDVSITSSGVSVGVATFTGEVEEELLVFTGDGVLGLAILELTGVKVSSEVSIFTGVSISGVLTGVLPGVAAGESSKDLLGVFIGDPGPFALDGVVSTAARAEARLVGHAWPREMLLDCGLVRGDSR